MVGEVSPVILGKLKRLRTRTSEGFFHEVLTDPSGLRIWQQLLRPVEHELDRLNIPILLQTREDHPWHA